MVRLPFYAARASACQGRQKWLNTDIFINLKHTIGFRTYKQILKQDNPSVIYVHVKFISNIQSTVYVNLNHIRLNE